MSTGTVSVLPKNYIVIGDYTIYRRPDNKIWIENAKGEGGSFSEDQVMPIIEAFFRENF